MGLVRIRGASKRTRNPRTLTVEEFQQFVQHLPQPFTTVALLCCCLGLCISECLALKWSDVDWLNGKLLVERGIVSGQVDDVKTAESRKKLVIDCDLLTALQTWKQQPNSPTRKIGCLLHRSITGGCRGPTTKFGACIKRQRTQPALAAWALTAYATPTAPGSTLWE